MSDYWKKKMDELENEKKKTPSLSYWERKQAELEEEQRQETTVRSARKDDDEDDIAPIKSTKEKGGLEFFQKPEVFDDGGSVMDVVGTVLGTVGDAGVNALKGLLGLSEGVADLINYGIAGVADKMGEDAFASGVREATKENLFDHMLAPVDNFLDKYSVLGRTSDAILKGVGQVGTIIATGGVGASAGLSSAGATALTTGVMGVSGMGSGMSEAYQSGATDKEAAIYGAISGASDAITELIFGGLGKGINAVGLSKGISSADDMLAKKVSSMFTNQIMKNVSEYGIKAGAEGLEEVLAGIAQAAGKKATYMSEEEFSKILKDENLLEQFVVGAVTSGIAQVPGLHISNKSGTDFITGMTQNEQSVVNKEVENRIAEAEADGKKLTAKQKADIQSQVERDLEKGYISTDLIEEVVGGETYRAYHESEAREDALFKEYEELGKATNPTLAQQYRYRELDTRVKSIRDNDIRSKRKDHLDQFVSEQIKGSRLAESYNEKARRGQAFEADLTKYDEKQQAVIKKAVESGILNNTNRTHEFVDMVAKISADKGVLFDFTNNEKLKTSGFAVDGKAVNGYVTKDGITVNIQSSKALNSIVGHEITHVLEGTDLYTELQNAVVEYAKTKGDYQGRFDSLSKLYEAVEGADINAELTADLVGDYLFTDADFINNLSTDHRNVFQKIYDEVKYLLKVATAGSKEARELEKVKRAFEKAYRESGTAQTDADADVHYSLRKEAPPKKTQKAYKLMRLQDGKLYPLFIGNNEEIAVDTWYNADSPNLSQLKDLEPGTHLVDMETGEAITWDEYAEQHLPKKNGKPARSKPNKADIHWANDNGYRFMHIEDKAGGKSEGTMLKQYGDTRAYYNWGVNGSSKSKTGEGSASLYALRPGWHFGELPTMHQIGYGGKTEDTFRLDNQVWVEVDMAADVDYNAEAESNWGGDIPTHIPEDGYYKFATNPTQKKTKGGDTANDATKGDWYVAGAFKVNRILSDTEADAIVEQYNKETGKNIPLDYRRKDGRKFNAETMSVEDVKYSLSAEQQEFFKDSVVRDENGDLKVMYHGTSAGGHTMFDPYGKARYGLFGAGSYFTDSKTIAESYTKKGKGKTPQVYETYLNIKNPMDMDAAADPAQWAKAFPDAQFPESGTNEQFYRAMENYFEDEQYARWEAAEAAMEALEGMGYDGITHIGGGRVNPDGERHRVYIAFDSKQIKSVANTKPTAAADIRYSLSDSNGKKLSAAQSEYFKDSKVRDENGSLMVMYHGTPNGEFTVFKDGTYFTASKEYADRYQNPSASSISTGKVASAPKTFEVYLDIKKPFDINDAEARSIYINDYIKGGNALGINPYLSDAEYAKIETIDWTEGEDLRDFLIENEYDYDGLVLDEGGTGGYGDEVQSRGKSYVVFSPEQVKNIDNLRPTADPDIRFSLSEAVEETRDLMAIHNLQSSELPKALALGGMPMPSIAVLKAQQSHESYGDVSLIFPKDAIDPQKNKDNKIYGGDAWTPVYPSIEYKASAKVQRAIESKIDGLVPYEVQSGLGHLALDYDNLSSDLNRYNGDMYQAYRHNYAMQYAFLVDNGFSDQLPMTEKQLDGSGRFDNSVVMDVVQKLGHSEVERLANESIYDNEALISELRELANENAKARYAGDSKLLEVLRNRPLYTEKNFGFAQADSLIRAAYRYIQKGVEQTVDYKNAKDVIEKAVDTEAYKKWLDNLFSGIVEKEGIRNNADYYTPSGNRRSWEALHWENTLENVLKVMKAQNETGQGFFGGASIFGVANKNYGSIEEVKADSDRLRTMPEEEYDALKSDLSNRLAEIADSIKDPNERNRFIALDHAAEEIVDAVRARKTKTGILQYMQKWNKRVTSQTVDDIVSLINDVANMPTGYFEAKPRRAVGFDEVAVFVIPYDADVKLKQELLNRGYSIAEYDPNVEGDRQKVVNQFEEYKFSLSDAASAPKTYGSYNVYGKDIALETEREIAPVTVAENATVEPTVSEVESVAPVAISKTETTTEESSVAEELFPDDLAPMSEEMEADRLASLDDADAPPEVEAPYYEGQPVTADDPFEDRAIEDVGNRKTKAYMYENPEVKPFFQAEAKVMLGELGDSMKGERWFNGQLYYDTNGEQGWGGTRRYTSDDIAYLLDEWHYTYKQIQDGLNAIIEDNGKENNAVSKRIEFILNDRLQNGYTDFRDGYEYPPDQDYINLLNEKQINEYSAEAFERFMANADQYAPPAQEEDIAPVAAPKAQEPEAPLYDAPARKGVVEGQQSMFEETNDPVAKRLAKEKAALAEEYQKKKAEIQKDVLDKNGYISRSASELYQELRGLRKGVKASDRLGYLLDHGYEWSAVRAALVNIQHTPERQVNQNSVIENIARQMLNEDYEGRVYELDRVESEYQKKLTEAEEKADAERTNPSVTRKALHERIIDNIKASFAEKGFDFDTVLKKAKNLSTFATVDNIPQRVMEKALGYKEGGILSDITVNKVAQNETEGIKWLNSFTDRKKGLLAQISKQYGIKPGSKESAAAQMYAEGFYVAENNDIIKYGDAELAIDFPDARVRANIKALAKDQRIRRIYDETLAAINEARTRNAYPEIQKLDNYFLHFRAMNDTFSKLGLPFNPNDIRAKDLPTDLNGVTADLKPGQPFFASAMHRTGIRTSFDLLGGLEKYLTSAKNQIYHIDDIQNLRALRNYIADTYGQANGLEGLDALSEEEQQQRIEQVYNSHLSTFAKFLNEEANVLAGKTALIDRGLEGIIGRRGMTFLDSVNRQVGANMVGYNISSSLTNFLAPVQAFAKGNKAAFVKGMAQFAANKVQSIYGKGDGFAEQSSVMIRRKGAERFHRTFWQKMSDPGYALMGAVDQVSTELIARAKYNELIGKGMDSQQAHIETDKWVSRLMGDRSLGQQPQLYNSKMLGIVTKFQLEVRNQLDSQFYDTIQEAKVSNEDIQNGLLRNAKTAAKVTSTFFQLAVAQHLFGKAFESVAGYNPAFDIISAIIKAFGWDDDEESEDTALDNLEQGFFELLEDMPYTSTFTGGRIPISSALPVAEFIKGKDQYGNEKSRLETLGEAAPYYFMPGGYGQVKKTVAGLQMFSDEHPIAGSYTDSGNLRFPVEDTTASRVQAAVFGQYASSNARDYFDNERRALTPNQTQELIDVGISIQDYWKYREGLSKLSKLEEKMEYVNGLDLTTEQKNVLVNNLTDRKEAIDMTDYDLYDSLEEFDYANKNPEKYAFFEDIGISYETYKNADDDTKDAYDWAFDNPDKYPVAKAVASDVVEYRRYASELYDIKADKDENGKSISGSRKEKVLAYINGLDIDYGAKLILFKNEYNADDESNYEIIDYLNGRSDISFEEEVAILRELGFTVTDDGDIYWD